MARHLNGSLLGSAARTHLRDIQEEEQMRRHRFARDWKQTLQALEYFLGDSFEMWWDSYPEDVTRADFLPIMKAKLDEIDGTLQNTYAQIDELDEIEKDWKEQISELRGTI